VIDGKGDFFGIAEKCGKSVVSYQLSVISCQISEVSENSEWLTADEVDGKDGKFVEWLGALL
jgi:hypothetical protein